MLANLEYIDIGSRFKPVCADEPTLLPGDVLVVARGRARVIIKLKYYGHSVDLERSG